MKLKGKDKKFLYKNLTRYLRSLGFPVLGWKAVKQTLHELTGQEIDSTKKAFTIFNSLKSGELPLNSAKQCNHGKGNWDETDFRPKDENLSVLRPNAEISRR